MDDMSAFERQVAGEMLRRAGPVRRVDDAAIFTAITATQSPRWRVQAVFGVTRFVVAGVIVALFGGFLLARLPTTQPSEERMPAVGASASAQATPTDATAEPQPTLEPERTETSATAVRSDLLPSVDLEVEEVESGIFRVINDGVRDLTWTTSEGSPGWPYSLLGGEVVVSADGSVWNMVVVPDDRQVLYRLGDAESETTTPQFIYGSSVAADTAGRLWALADDGRRATIQSVDGGAWTVQRNLPRKRCSGSDGLEGLVAASGGEVWAWWTRLGGYGCRAPVIGRWSPGTGRWLVGPEGSTELPSVGPQSRCAGRPSSSSCPPDSAVCRPARRGATLLAYTELQIARLTGIDGGRYLLDPVADSPMHRIGDQSSQTENAVAATDDGTVWVRGVQSDDTPVLARTRRPGRSAGMGGVRSSQFRSSRFMAPGLTWWESPPTGQPGSTSPSTVGATASTASTVTVGRPTWRADAHSRSTSPQMAPSGCKQESRGPATPSSSPLRQWRPPSRPRPRSEDLSPGGRVLLRPPAGVGSRYHVVSAALRQGCRGR